MSGCPCGHLGGRRREFRCPRPLIERYRSHISGLLADRIDVHVERPALSKVGLGSPASEPSSALAHLGAARRPHRRPRREAGPLEARPGKPGLAAELGARRPRPPATSAPEPALRRCRPAGLERFDPSRSAEPPLRARAGPLDLSAHRRARTYRDTSRATPPRGQVIPEGGRAVWQSSAMARLLADLVNPSGLLLDPCFLAKGSREQPLGGARR
jgi:hypothetical protein